MFLPCFIDFTCYIFCVFIIVFNFIVAYLYISCTQRLLISYIKLFAFLFGNLNLNKLWLDIDGKAMQVAQNELNSVPLVEESWGKGMKWAILLKLSTTVRMTVLPQDRMRARDEVIVPCHPQNTHTHTQKSESMMYVWKWYQTTPQQAQKQEKWKREKSLKKISKFH